MAQDRLTVHDVVIIGSGAGGGTVTKVLADLGVRVLLMEAGPMVTMGDFKTHGRAAQTPGIAAPAKRRRSTRPARGRRCSYNASFAANIVDEPYTVAPGSQFRLFRSRVIGGRTNHYARIQLRYSDYDFKPKSMRGVGWDWPIGYEDLAPYYDKAERFIGVTGRPKDCAARRTASSRRRRRARPHELSSIAPARSSASRRRARARRSSRAP